MKNWKYSGLDEKRKEVTGALEATSIRDVRKQLRNKGIRPQKITAPIYFRCRSGGDSH